MTFRVIDNKKVDMTDDEYNEYIKICRAYDKPFCKGEELFRGLFETNDDGMIIYIKSLGNRQFTFEVIFFIMNLMQNQWLRAMAVKVNNKLAEIEQRMAAIEKKSKQQ